MKAKEFISFLNILRKSPKVNHSLRLNLLFEKLMVILKLVVFMGDTSLLELSNMLYNR